MQRDLELIRAILRTIQHLRSGERAGVAIAGVGNGPVAAHVAMLAVEGFLDVAASANGVPLVTGTTSAGRALSVAMLVDDGAWAAMIQTEGTDKLSVLSLREIADLAVKAAATIAFNRMGVPFETDDWWRSGRIAPLTIEPASELVGARKPPDAGLGGHAPGGPPDVE